MSSTALTPNKVAAETPSPTITPLHDPSHQAVVIPQTKPLGVANRESSICRIYHGGTCCMCEMHTGIVAIFVWYSYISPSCTHCRAYTGQPLASHVSLSSWHVLCSQCHRARPNNRSIHPSWFSRSRTKSITSQKVCQSQVSPPYAQDFSHVSCSMWQLEDWLIVILAKLRCLQQISYNRLALPNSLVLNKDISQSESFSHIIRSERLWSFLRWH